MNDLTLYRRHTKSCTKGYRQNHRVFFPSTKLKRAKDCACPISAEGTLSVEGFITNRSTKTTTWPEAQAIAAKWEAAGTTLQQETREPTVQYAIESFLASYGPSGRNVEANTYSGFKVLLEKRLGPFCAKHGITHIKAFNDLDLTSKFVESWTNLLKPGPLGDRTKKTEVERLRSFLAYCLDRKWVTVNTAKKIKFSTKVEKKFGMEPDEVDKLLAVVDPELRTFCLIMRHGGLRISDATTFNHQQLVQRASGNGWAFKVYQKKTKEWVYVPIPADVEAALRALPFKSEKDGKRYWFWTSNGLLKTARCNWYTRIMRAVKEVEPFIHPVTPHTFRHTFAISHLNAGTDIKFVSRWLGHASTSVTEKHYAHAVRNTLLASEEAYDASMRRQEEQRARWNRQNLVLTATG